MASYSIIHWVVMALVAVLTVIPVYLLLRQTGRPPALALLALFMPFALIMLCWLVWDAQRRRDDAPNFPDRRA